MRLENLLTSIKRMTKPAGGRGKKAPYRTVVMRVPEPIAEKVESLINGYRILAINGLLTQDDLRRLEPWHSEFTPISKSEAIGKAKEILSQQKSADKAILELIEFLYGQSINFD